MEGVFSFLTLAVDVDGRSIVGIESHECDNRSGLELSRLNFMRCALGFGLVGLPVGEGHFGIVRKRDAHGITQGILGVGGDGDLGEGYFLFRLVVVAA